MFEYGGASLTLLMHSDAQYYLLCIMFYEQWEMTIVSIKMIYVYINVLILYKKMFQIKIHFQRVINEFVMNKLEHTIP